MKKVTISMITLLMFCTSLFASSMYWVNGYSRTDGTYVSGHYKTTPDAYKWNNLSY